MAVVDYQVVDLDANQQYPTGVRVVLWEGMNANDTATAYTAPQYSGKVVQASGSGAAVTMQGTLVPTATVPVWSTLHDPASADLVLSDAEIRQVLEDCYQIRPTMSTGTDIDVYLMVTTSSRR